MPVWQFFRKGWDGRALLVQPSEMRHTIWKILFVSGADEYLERLEGRIRKYLTEPRWPLQPRGTQWFLRIGLFVVRAISLGPCRRPIEYLTSSHPCGRLSKIPNSQIHKVKKWKILSNFRRKDFFVISHGHKDRFFVVIRPKKTPGHIKYWPRIDPTKVGHF